jgi:dihydrofolate reductase
MTLIAAVDRAWGIGSADGLLFRVPADFKRFRALTMGRALLMGRKTFESLPGPLPGRAHAVLSRDPSFGPTGVTVLRSLAQAREYAQGCAVFLIGGGEVFRALLDDCEAAYITKVDTLGGASVFMPDLDALPQWRLTREGPWQEAAGLRFHFCEYTRTE